MNVIEFHSVWKKFKKGEKLNSLRDMLPHLFRSALQLNAGELKKEEFWALKDVSFEVKKGDILGIIGSNGSGKSTTLKLLSQLLIPNKGKININGRIAGLIEITAGFHPELTGRENVYLNGTILGMKKKEIDSKFDEIVEFSGIKEFIHTPVKRYSSGMYSRLGFSVAAHLDPDILLVDEVLSVGDISFQAKCSQKMRELMNSGTTIVLVSHNLPLVQNLCKRIIFLDKGEIIKEGPAKEIIPYYEDIVYSKREEEIRKQMEISEYKVKIQEKQSVSILEAYFYNANNERKDNFKTRDPISIKFKFKSNITINKPIFSVDIIRADDILCCSADTQESGSLLDEITGTASLSVHFGNINLAPGVYIARISIIDKDMIYTYATRKRDMFRIELNSTLKQTTGIFLPKVKWETD